MLILASLTADSFGLLFLLAEAAVLLFNFLILKIPQLRSKQELEAAVEQEATARGTGGNLSMESFVEKERKRSLAYGAFGLLSYLIAGFWYGTRKGWCPTDSTYFVVVTFTTVGYGDKVFNVDVFDQIFGGMYVLVGVAFIGALVGEAIAELQDRAQRTAAKLKFESERVSREGDAPRQGGIAAVRAQIQAEKDGLRSRLWWSFGQCAALVLFGSIVMVYLQQWSFSYSFLWACVTATTVGYGDIVPTTYCGKYFSMVYIMLSFGVIANALGAIASTPKDTHRVRARERVLLQFGATAEAEELHALTSSEELQSLRIHALRDEPSVSRAEFMLWLLVRQHKLDLHQDIEPCGRIFDSLDPDNSGRLDEDDIKFFEERARRRDAEARQRRRRGTDEDQELGVFLMQRSNRRIRNEDLLFDEEAAVPA